MKSFLKGRVSNGLTDVDCMIRDLSATGATLTCSGGISLPSVIDLHIPLKNKTVRAKVNWRHGDEVDVSFFEDQPAVPKVGDDTELNERVAKIEKEIADLRKMLAALRRELFPHEELFKAG